MESPNQTVEMDSSSFYLGTVERQIIIPATAAYLTVNIIKLIEGVIMVCGNFLLFCCIMVHKQLRRKEMYIIAGLAMGDFIYGWGYIFAGFRLTGLGLVGKQFWMVSPWKCMGALHNPFFIIGSQAAGLMLVMISIDRLLAVKWFSYYMALGERYAKVTVLTVFSYSCFTLIVIVFLSAFGTGEDQRVVALCLSTQVGPLWLSSYQPMVQMTCGILSVVIYIVLLYFFKKQTAAMNQSVQNQNLQKQRKLTKTLGITVLFTLFTYVIPHSLIMIFNRFEGMGKWASELGPYVWPIGNINSIVNIFILGIRNNDIRRVLKAWIRFKKAQFTGGHAVSLRNTPHH